MLLINIIDIYQTLDCYNWSTRRKVFHNGGEFNKSSFENIADQFNK